MDLDILGSFALAAVTWVLIACYVFYVRARIGPQPGYFGLLIAYGMWAACFLVMARGRFAVRDRPILAGELMPWSRITGCAATGDDMLRMHLDRSLRDRSLSESRRTAATRSSS